MIKYQSKGKFLFILVFMTMTSAINSCRYTKEIRQIKKKEDCKGVISFLEKNWKYDKKKDIYIRTKEFHKKFAHDGAYRECFNGLSSAGIIELLGPPHERHPRSLKYYNNTNCHDDQGGEYRCYGTDIDLNSNGTVIDMDLLGWWSSGY